MNQLHEQNNGLVALDGSMRPLPILEAWCGSSAAFWFSPDAPYAAMSFKVGKSDNSGFNDSIVMMLHPSRGLWRAYVPRSMFTAKCQTFYKITAVDEYGNRHVCGEGIFRVHSGAIYDPEDGYDPTAQCYICFQDGNWRRVTVITDSVGELCFSVAQTPTEPISGQTFTTPYAYRKADGLYYALTGFIDEVGEAYISVAEVGVDGKDAAFAMDDTSGFYYRVEALKDSTGTMTTSVGERK